MGLGVRLPSQSYTEATSQSKHPLPCQASPTCELRELSPPRTWPARAVPSSGTYGGAPQHDARTPRVPAHSTPQAPWLTMLSRARSEFGCAQVHCGDASAGPEHHALRQHLRHDAIRLHTCLVFDEVVVTPVPGTEGEPDGRGPNPISMCLPLLGDTRGPTLTQGGGAWRKPRRSPPWTRDSARSTCPPLGVVAAHPPAAPVQAPPSELVRG